MNNTFGCSLALVIVSVLGCSQKFGPADGAMERSRQINELEDQNKSLKLQVAELKSKEESTSSHSEGNANQGDLPRPVELVLAGGSEVRSGAKPTATVRFQTLDAHGRFVQVTGPVEVVLVAIGDDDNAHRLMKVELTPEALRARLRSGFMGMAYSVPVPLFKKVYPWIPAAGGSVLAKVTLQDTRISKALVSEKLIPVLPPRGE